MINKNFNPVHDSFTSIGDEIIPSLSFAPELITNSMENSDPLSPKDILYEKITTIFMTIGIPAHVKGYHFLREAIQLAVGNFDVLNGVMKKLYPLVANRFNTKACIVERNIRNAIEIACNRGKMINLNSIFGIVIFERNDKPTNSELIALLVEKLYLDCKIQVN